MILRNVRCKWASVIEPNTTYDPVWEIQAVLDEAQAAELADKGYKIRTEEDGSLSYRFKQKVQGNKKGGGTFDHPKPLVIDGDKKPFEKLIGNGSLVNIQYEHQSGHSYGQDWVKGVLRGVQVVEHVPFGEVDEFEEVGATKQIEDTSTVVDTDASDDDIPF